MATPKKEETLPTVPETKAVANKTQSWLAGYQGTGGMDQIEVADIAIPRIKIGQSMSDEVKSGACAEGDLFINVTGEIIAKAGEPLRFIPVAYAKEYMLWRDRKDNGGGILARAKKIMQGGQARYEWDKPHEKFENKVDGKIKVVWETKQYCTDKKLDECAKDEDNLAAWGSEIPGDDESGIAATAHHNYVVMLPDFDNMVCALSLSRSQTKRAKDLNAAIKMSKIPMFARVFKATTETENKDANSYKNYRFKPAGMVEDEDVGRAAMDMYENFASKGFTVDQRDGDNDAGSASDKGQAF